MKSLLSVVFVVACASGAWAQSQPTGSWANETSGAYFYYGACVTDGTYMYVYGGYQTGAGNASGDAYRVTRRYDVVNNTWSTLADMPTQCYLNCGAYYGGSLYSFGNGYYGNGAIYRYVISSNSWSQVSNLTYPRYYAAASTYGSTIFCTGGYYAGYTNMVDEYNPTSNTVTARATMPNGVGYHGQATVDSIGKIYVIGGYNNAYLAICYEYTPPSQAAANGSWVTKTPITVNGSQSPRGLMPACFTLNTYRVYVAGGYNNGQQNTCLEYNAITDTWVQRANMSNARYYTGGCAINGKGYVYGGPPAYQSCEEYTPPEFGQPPPAPTGLAQIGSSAASSLQAQADATQPDGWTNNQIQFTANVTDPDLINGAPQQVRFRVQVKPAAAAWTQANQVTSLATNLGAQGVHTLTYNVPADGAFDWRWRVEDTYSNSYPLGASDWVEAFGTFAAQNTNSPDFRSDQIPPSDPIATNPHNFDYEVPDPVYGDVTLNWIESQDNGPVSGISYEIQVARDGGFSDIEAQLFSTAGTSSYPVTLTVSRFNKYWRIRAKDIGGNLSNWSAPLNFRVTYNDGFDHGAGDAKKYCGMTATAVPGLGSAILGLVVFGLAALRRKLA